MTITWSHPLRQHGRLILQEAGYHFFVDPHSQKESFIMRMSRGFYPRFHVYVSREHDRMIFDLHIDQTKQSLGSRMHAGEYHGSVVEEEAARLTRWLEHYTVV